MRTITAVCTACTVALSYLGVIAATETTPPAPTTEIAKQPSTADTSSDKPFWVRGVITSKPLPAKIVYYNDANLKRMPFILHRNDTPTTIVEAVFDRYGNLLTNYRPRPVTVDIVSETIEKTVPFTTRYKVDDSLAEGTEKIITKGQDGKVRVTTTFSVDLLTNTRKKLSEKTETLTKMTQQVVARAPKNTSANTSGNTDNGFSGSEYEESRAAFALWNEYRRAHGLAEITWSESMYQHARARSKALVRDFSHRGARYFENIAVGQESAQAIITSWRNSPPHNRNLLNPSYRQGAIAVYVDKNSEYVYHWTMVGI